MARKRDFISRQLNAWANRKRRLREEQTRACAGITRTIAHLLSHLTCGQSSFPALVKSFLFAVITAVLVLVEVS